MIWPFISSVEKKTCKNSVQSLYYLFTKAGVLSLRDIGGAGKKKKKKSLENIKWSFSSPCFQRVTAKRGVCIGIGKKKIQRENKGLQTTQEKTL